MPYEVFISYSHKDKALRDELETHLSNLKRQHIVTSWYDGDISPGTEWEQQILTHLDAAQIILLLVSADFMASDFCYSREMKQAMIRHDGNQARVIPILLRPTGWEGAPFGKLQALPPGALPVTSWQNRDEALLQVTEGIRKVIEELHRQNAVRPSSSFPLWNIPYDRNPLFTGREDVLKRLHDMLSTGKTTTLTQPQAISGLGGIGKTQTAVEYAYRYQDDYDAIFWVKADASETLMLDFLTIAHLLNLPERNEQDQHLVVEAVKRWLQSHMRWLLIFDNADDLALTRSFLPLGGKGHTLLTTRTQVTGRMAQRVELAVMILEEGALFLLHRATILAPGDSLGAAAITDQVTAKEIVQVLDGLPLALDQAGAYIDETHCGLSGYLQLYRTRQTDLLKKRGKLVSDHPEPVATTWSLSFEKVQQANPAAADLLRLCAFLDPDSIPEEIITMGAPELGSALHALATEPLALNEAMGVLLTYSLVRRNPDHTLTIHRLVQVVLKQGMNKSTGRRWAERAVRAVNLAFPQVDYDTWLQCQQYLPHTQACAALIDAWDMHFPEAADLLMRAGDYLRQHAQYTQAEPLFQRALAISEKMLGPEHPSTATTLNNLAGLHCDQGEYEQAEPLFQRALAIREKMLGPEHPDTVTVIENYSTLLSEMKREAEAGALARRAEAIRRKHV